ncbi:RNA 2',3'-cyclic phosphodiesterase [Stakelama tenebrarum]|uniref:RNA 2',3'-cyclic phosphodiesterase n=1 Tax=Stakelama tenebrarum TaxID=2711215 RepID=A0A6G6Y2Z7_9SPHN|nr:RNA 2',3'-cyclic phosphodiesterase [Sphingosinithalassobacter tenebrarum]QIG79302.1 RNA 2',3'-cyclic phosphodiesterase [Sphingosinithalassobacter tenebrarum]
MHRLFVGFRPPPAIREALLAAHGGIPGARWQRDDQLHITLRFIGDVDMHRANDAAIALAAIRGPAFEVAIDGVGCFESKGRPNAVWAGIRPREAITQLHQKADQALVRTGLSPEHRAYFPHITLARMSRTAGSPDRWLADHAGLATPRFLLTEFLLFESRLGGEGATYEAVERYPLEGRG